MDVPNVSRTEFALLDIDDDFCSLMNADGSTKDDVKVPDGELGQKLKAEFAEGKELSVTVM
jgi:translation initiation factor 5A